MVHQLTSLLEDSTFPISRLQNNSVEKENIRNVTMLHSYIRVSTRLQHTSIERIPTPYQTALQSMTTKQCGLGTATNKLHCCYITKQSSVILEGRLKAERVYRPTKVVVSCPHGFRGYLLQQ